MLLKTKSIAVLMLSLCLALGTGSWAAELRSNLGNRDVVRQVRYVKRQPAQAQEEVILEGEGIESLAEGCDSCGVGGCDSCGGCGCCFCLPCFDLSGTWANFEYLLWWRQGSPIPPLVTTSPLGTPQASAGIDPRLILYGNQTIDRDAKAGGRITLGHYLDRCRLYSVEGRYFALGDARARFSTNSDVNPIIARPFFNTDPAVNARDAELIAFADLNGAVTTGSIDVYSESEVSGADVYLRRVWCRSPCWQIDLLAGYQFSRIDETLQINSFTNDPRGITLSVEDLFATENEFHGGTLGLAAKFNCGRWRMDVLAKLGLGRMAQRVAISGQRVTTAGGLVQAFDSGLFAQSFTGNTGVFEQSNFNVVPEVGITFSYAITNCLSINFGGSIIYWNSVVQPVDQIDFSVDGRLLDAPNGPIIPPPPTNPEFEFRPSDYYVHGLNVGLEYRF